VTPPAAPAAPSPFAPVSDSDAPPSPFAPAPIETKVETETPASEEESTGLEKLPADESPTGGEPVAEDEVSVENVQAPEVDAPGEKEEDDPFADWPQGDSAEVIEDMPGEGTSVEHVAGEIDVPDGYSVLEGTPTGHRRTVAIVVARFNGGLTNRMLATATQTLEDAGVAPDAVTITIVPGAFELPLAAMALAKTRRYACVVALGAIVRGETPHFDYIAAEAASGLQLAAIETGVPCAFGVLTVETVEQAEARIDRAAEAVRTALEMADVFAQLRASARA
jgi:6,7-dimethyl-8-ribityllumazine synthase